MLLFAGLVLPGLGKISAGAEEGGALPIPDLSLWYSASSLYALAAAYGPVGRSAFIRSHFSLDLIWPAIYLLFLSSAISFSSKRAFRLGSPWRRSNLLPLAAVIFDLLENLACSLVMFRYPDQTPLLDSAAGYFTSIKWIFVASSVGLLLTGVLLARHQQGARSSS